MLGVAYFGQGRTELCSFGLTILKHFAKPFKFNSKDATERNNLPKLLSDLSITASFWFIESRFHPKYRSLDEFGEEDWAPIFNKGVESEDAPEGKKLT